jgi:uncharacterized protein (DUF433 family)
MHERLKVIAARKRTSMREYCMQAIERRIGEEPAEYLTARTDPVLSELWDNDDDAVDDHRFNGGVRFTRITVEPGKMGGAPCMRAFRIPVATVVAMVADGMTEAEILGAFPDLEPEDIREALQYAAEAVKERVLPLSGGR